MCSGSVMDPGQGDLAMSYTHTWVSAFQKLVVLVRGEWTGQVLSQDMNMAAYKPM